MYDNQPKTMKNCPHPVNGMHGQHGYAIFSYKIIVKITGNFAVVQKP